MNLVTRNKDLRKFNDSLLSSVMSNWDDFFPNAFTGSSMGSAGRMPAVDVRETETEFQFIADLPGIDKDNLEVSLINDVLSLTVRSENEKTEEFDGRIIRQERYRGSFNRSFKLNESVDEEKIQANYKNGVLSIQVPKKEPAQLKKIKVASH